MRRLLALTAVVACTLCLSTRAYADKAADARKHEASGFSHFKKQRYDQAIVSWRAAYELSKRPILLYDLALAFHRKGDALQAIDHYQRYLADEPAGEVAGESRAAVDTLRAELAEARRKQAEPLVRQAEAYAAAGAWADAAAEFSRAHAVSNDPELLFRAGDAHRQSGDSAAAISHYRDYLERAPAGASAAAARNALAELARLTDVAGETRRQTALATSASGRASQAAERAAAAAERGDRAAEAADVGAAERAARDAERAALAAEGAHREAREAQTRAGTDDARRRVEDAGIAAREARSAADQARIASARASANRAALRSRSRRGRSLRIAGLFTAAGGAVLAITGVAFGVHARTISDEVSDARVWSPALDERVADGEASERNAIVLTSVGSAAFVTGAVLYLVGRSQGAAERSAVAFTPRLTPQGIDLALAGRF